MQEQQLEKMVDPCHKDHLNNWTGAGVFVRREEEKEKPNRGIKRRGLRILH